MNLLGLLPLVLIFVVMYFLLIRPQQKRAQQQQKLVASLEPGDEVVTIGGVYGDIVEVDDQAVILEVYDGTQIRFLRSAVARKVLPESAFEDDIDLVEEEEVDVADDDAVEAEELLVADADDDGADVAEPADTAAARTPKDDPKSDKD